MPHAAKGGIGKSDESVHGPYACHAVEYTYTASPYVDKWLG